jgi:toxin-antitoxin system PIN domain toxin
MILCDANLLLYAYNTSAPEHPKARAWLESCLSSPAPFALSWSTIGAFLRLATHRAIFPAPYSIAEAARIADAWLARPMVVVLEPGPRFWAIARPLLEQSNARGPLVADALLAALALEHGATLATHDLDFRRFEGLSLLDPVAA